MSHRAQGAFHLAMDAIDREVYMATFTADGSCFVDSFGHTEDLLDADRRAILTGNGFERVPDGRWMHPKVGKVLSRKLVEETDASQLRLLIALALF